MLNQFDRLVFSINGTTLAFNLNECHKLINERKLLTFLESSVQVVHVQLHPSYLINKFSHAVVGS
jgi:hypothetical protein